MYYPYGTMTLPEVVEEPKKPSGLVFACIYKSGGQTFCGRMPASSEYTFSREGAEHEINFYDPRTLPKPHKGAQPRLTACTECLDKAKALIEKEGISRLA